MEFDFDAEKNQLLKKTRGISFEEILALIELGHPIEVLAHHNQERYQHQHILEIEIDEYVYLIPCIITNQKITLITIYPSRKATTKKKGKLL